MRPDDLAPAHAGQVLVLLLLGAKGEDRHLHAPHLGVHGKDQAVVAAGIAQAFHGEHGGQDIGFCAAILLRERQPLDAIAGAFQPLLAREAPLAIVFDDIPTKLLLWQNQPPLADTSIVLQSRKNPSSSPPRELARQA